MAKKHGSGRAAQVVRTGNQTALSPGKDAVTRSVKKTSEVAGVEPGREIKWHPLFVLVPVGLALITSLNTLSDGFAADDTTQILNNGLIKHLGNIPNTFFTSVWAFASNDIVFATDTYYRPLFNVLLTLNYAIFGNSAWGWHLSNALIHSGVVYLVFLVLREMTDDNWTAGISALLFAVHPAHSESVAWASGITDPWMALFALPAVYCYWKYAREKRPIYILGSAGFYFLALLVKETAVAIPLLVLFGEAWYFAGSRSFGERVRGIIGALLPFAVPTAAYAFMRYHALSGLLFGNVPLYPLGPALQTIPLALVKYIGLMLVPGGYSYLHHEVLVASAGSFAFWGPLAAIIGIAAAVALSRSRLLVLCGVWFLVWLAPALVAIRRFDPQFVVQERYLYVPSIGVCLAAGLGLRWLAGRAWFGINWRVPAIATLAAATIVLAGVYIAQNRTWRDDLSLYHNGVDVDPQSPFGRAFLANAYVQAGKPKDAEREAQSAVEAGPEEPEAYIALAYVADSQGKIDQAIRHLQKGIDAVPEGPMTRYRLATMYLNLGELYKRNKDAAHAETCLVKSIELWRRPAGSYYLAEFYFDQGRYQEARDMYQSTLSQVPERFAPIHLKLARVSDKLGDIARAKSEYELYLSLAPQADNRQEVIHRLSEL
jgi:tetratricopeptide (TPR) repeat protein